MVSSVLLAVVKILRFFDRFRSNMNVNFRNFRISIVMIVSMHFSLADSNSASKKHYDWQCQTRISRFFEFRAFRRLECQDFQDESASHPSLRSAESATSIVIIWIVERLARRVIPVPGCFCQIDMKNRFELPGVFKAEILEICEFVWSNRIFSGSGL